MDRTAKPRVLYLPVRFMMRPEPREADGGADRMRDEACAGGRGGEAFELEEEGRVEENHE